MEKVFLGEHATVYVCGDLHGDYRSFKSCLNKYDLEGRSFLLFLGDYADRGSQGVEIISELNALLECRNDIAALKGNHESYTNCIPDFMPCDLVSEAGRKHSSWEQFFRDVMKVFMEKLYIAAVINNVLFVHGGVSSRIESPVDLTRTENSADLIWSDPSPLPGEHPNRRGKGVMFGEDITAAVLGSLGLKLIVRSHEPGKASCAPFAEHGGRVITVNSCSSYGGRWKPFILRVDTQTAHCDAVYL